MQERQTRSGVKRSHWAALVCLLFPAVAAFGCTEELAGAGETCTTTADCKSGLRCRGGACRGSGAMDGDAGMDGGNGEEVSEEDYLISYTEVNEEEGSRRLLKVHNTANGETKVVVPDEMENCNQRACFVSGNFEYFFASESTGDQKDLLRWEIGSDLTAQGSSTTFIQNYRTVRMLKNHVQFKRGPAGEEKTGFVKPLSGGQPTEVATFANDGSFLTAPEHDRAVVFDPQGTQEMEVKLGTLQEQTAQLTLGGSNWQQSGGSYFGGEVTAAFSDDGSRLTFLTSAPNNYETCQRSDPQDRYSGDCDTVAARCGSQQLCSRWEITAHIVDMEHREQIGTQCSFDDDCAGVHECYVPSDEQTDRARCIPRRVVLGVPRSVQQNQMDGCQLVQQDSTVDFTNARGPISYDDKNRPYLTGRRDRSCIEEFGDSQPAGQVIRLNPQTGDYSYVEGLPVDQTFDPSTCYDNASDEYTPDSCVPFVGAAHLSPEGNEVAFSGTIPGVTTARQASTRVNIWHSLRDRSDRWFVSDPSTIFQLGRTLDVHPLPSDGE